MRLTRCLLRYRGMERSGYYMKVIRLFSLSQFYITRHPPLQASETMIVYCSVIRGWSGTILTLLDMLKSIHLYLSKHGLGFYNE